MGNIIGIETVSKIQHYEVEAWDSAETYPVTFRTTGHGWWERRYGGSWEDENSDNVVLELENYLNEYFEKHPDAR